MEKFPKCLAAYSLDKDRIKSSSGGIFAELAKKILDDSGVVFGASIDSEGRVFHKYITKSEELNELLGSKYVQSDVGTSYKNVRNFLKEGRKVLFCGTPCQNEGLLSFLKEKPDNLVMVDCVCHGVPSFKVFNAYLKELSKGREVDRIYFRDKEKGWLDYQFRIDYSDGRNFKEVYRDNNYMKGFVYDLYLRPSCYSCKFKGINRNTDITMGDFWGIKEEESDFFEENGVSVLLLHNEKAISIISEIQDKIESREIDVEEIIRHNPSLVKASNNNIMRTLFFADMKRGVNKAVEGIINPDRPQKFRNKLYRGFYKLRKRCNYNYKKKAIIECFNEFVKIKYERSGGTPKIFESKEECCGCYACANVCPKEAITMYEDKEGFAYPIIDNDLCVGCNNCVRVCPVKKCKCI